jgi:hypothetical protein
VVPKGEESRVYRETEDLRKRRVHRLLCLFLHVLMHLLVRNHVSVHPVLTVQAHAYEIVNRNEMIVLVTRHPTSLFFSELAGS